LGTTQVKTSSGTGNGTATSGAQVRGARSHRQDIGLRAGGAAAPLQLVPALACIARLVAGMIAAYGRQWRGECGRPADGDGDGKGEVIALVTTITEMTAAPWPRCWRRPITKGREHRSLPAAAWARC